MSSAKRLCVVHLPSPHDPAWRHALGEAATAAGWAFVQMHDAEPAVPDVQSDVLFACVDAKLVSSLQPTDVVVLAGPTGQSITSLITTFGIDHDNALKATARFYAHASDLVQAGAQVYDPASLTIQFPGLGEITREPSAGVGTPASPGPLAFYDSLPVKAGASAVWPVTIFNWMGGPDFGKTDLTGRRRMLQHGPYIELSSGEWAIDVKFALTLDRAQVDLRFEWGTVADTDTLSFSVSKEGVYATTLTKVWSAPDIAELRIWLDRSMFDGAIEIEDCVVRRLG